MSRRALDLRGGAFADRRAAALETPRIGPRQPLAAKETPDRA
jgi:hypothetical protein